MTGPLRGVCRHLADWVSVTPGAVMHTVAEAERVVLPEPIFGPLPAKLRSMQIGVAPRGTVSVLPDAGVYSTDGLVVSSDGHAFADTLECWGWNVDAHPLFDRPPANARHIDGVVVSVLSRGAHGNISHFLSDLLPRIQLVHDTGMRADAWLVHRSTAAWAREGLTLAGLTVGEIVEIEPDELVTAATLVVPSPSGFAPRTAPWACRAAKRLLGRLVRPGNARIWVSRADASRRHVLNEDDVVRALRSMGFESVTLTGLPLAEQVGLIAGASIVIGAHGAGLSPVIAAPPGGTLIEFFHPRAIHPEYWRLAGLSGWRYQPLLAFGDGTNDRFVDCYLEDFVIDTKPLRGLIGAL